MDSHCAAAFEAEKAAITSYEDGWDRWDGPVWPWRHTNVPAAAAQEKMENEWAGCCEREAVSEEREVGGMLAVFLRVFFLGRGRGCEC